MDIAKSLIEDYEASRKSTKTLARVSELESIINVLTNLLAEKTAEHDEMIHHTELNSDVEAVIEAHVGEFDVNDVLSKEITIMRLMNKSELVLMGAPSTYLKHLACEWLIIEWLTSPQKIGDKIKATNVSDLKTLMKAHEVVYKNKPDAIAYLLRALNVMDASASSASSTIPIVEQTTIVEHDTRSVRARKERIPEAVRQAVWNKYIGVNEVSGECFVKCGAPIHMSNFECGHVEAEAVGGKLTVGNLRPICSKCNKSMGVMNLIEFKEKYGFTAE